MSSINERNLQIQTSKVTFVNHSTAMWALLLPGQGSNNAVPAINVTTGSRNNLNAAFLQLNKTDETNFAHFDSSVFLVLFIFFISVVTWSCYLKNRMIGSVHLMRLRMTLFFLRAKVVGSTCS